MMSTPVHGGDQLRFHGGPGRIFPTIDRQEPWTTDSRQGAILIQQSKSATAEDPPFISTFVWVLTVRKWPMSGCSPRASGLAAQGSSLPGGRYS